MPKIDNLYNNRGYIIPFDNGDRIVARRKNPYTLKSNADKYHIVMDGDRLDTIAFKYYGNSKHWWILADANDIEDSLINPFSLVTGTKLIIPDLENFENQ